MSQNQIMWVIFAAAMLLIPTCFFLILDFAIWPVMYPLVSQVLVSFVMGDFLGPIVVLINCLIWSAILYFSSKWLALKIANAVGGTKLIIISALTIAMAILSVAPIYDSGSNVDHKFSVIDLYKRFIVVATR